MTNSVIQLETKSKQTEGLLYLSQILIKPDDCDFKTMVKKAIESLSLDELPLQQALTQSSVALEGDLSVMLLGCDVTESSIQLRVGISFYGILSGCSCADDPTPVDRVNEYGEFVFTLNRETSEILVHLDN